jgi:phosphoribosylformylglycinamidine synthase
MCQARGLPCRKLGVVDAESDSVEIQDVATFPLAELRATWEQALPLCLS